MTMWASEPTRLLPGGPHGPQGPQDGANLALFPLAVYIGNVAAAWP